MRTTLMFCLALVFSAGTAQASINTYLSSVPTDGFVSFVTGAVDPSGGNSGFLGTIYDVDMNVLESWETFCVEGGISAESVQLNGTKYDIDSTSANTATATGNYVTPEAAWVYWAFSTMNLDGWTPNRGEEVQEAIWALTEAGGQGGSPLVNANGLAADWVQDAIDAVAGGWDGADRIRVINPTNVGNGRHRQSMLYMIPEPGTIAIWSALGVMGFIAIRKRNG